MKEQKKYKDNLDKEIGPIARRHYKAMFDREKKTRERLLKVRTFIREAWRLLAKLK